MGVPAAVKKQADLARKAHAQSLKPPASPPQGGSNISTNKSVDSEKDTDTPLPPLQQAPATRDSDPLTDWETRYKQMRAKGDIRSKELAAQLETANKKISDLEEQLKDLKANNNSSGTTESLLSEEEREFLGEQGSGVIERLQASHDAQVRKLEARIDDLTKVETDPPKAAASAQDSFMEDLDADAPDWREVNADKYFKAWLAQIDPQTGSPRQDDLDLAQGARDGKAVARIVNRFKALNGNAQGDQGVSYEPDTTRSGSSQIYLPGEVPEGHHVEYSGSDIKEFYSRKTKVMNRYRSGKASKEEIDRLAAEEAEIRKAYSEGRVTD